MGMDACRLVSPDRVVNLGWQADGGASRLSGTPTTRRPPNPSLTIYLAILRRRCIKVSLLRLRRPRPHPRPAHRLATNGCICRWCGAERHVRARGLFCALGRTWGAAGDLPDHGYV